eukprot:TRINITY_DN6616_c0_g1_i5.p2 TRINITY_DN6616_c0_g1~~TRINITY_DN6616_c0_g1_i5.p2  ORF type:complete len:138 (+),score=18.97 TRINITY_DN6616_c0_g1_i5:179-592(+)
MCIRDRIYIVTKIIAKLCHQFMPHVTCNNLLQSQEKICSLDNSTAGDVFISLVLILQVYIQNQKEDIYGLKTLDNIFIKFFPQFDIDQINIQLQLLQKLRSKQGIITQLINEKIPFQFIKKLIPQDLIDQVQYDLIN